MAFQFSTAARNAALDAIEAAIGAAGVLRIRSGAPPANCAAARTGTVLATMSLPANFFADAANGSKGLAGTWEDLAADAAGTAGHFELMDSTETTCHIQGTVTASGGGGDMTIDNTSVALGQEISVSSFTINAGGA